MCEYGACTVGAELSHGISPSLSLPLELELLRRCLLLDFFSFLLFLSLSLSLLCFLSLSLSLSLPMVALSRLRLKGVTRMLHLLRTRNAISVKGSKRKEQQLLHGNGRAGEFPVMVKARHLRTHHALKLLAHSGQHISSLRLPRVAPVLHTWHQPGHVAHVANLP